MKLRTLPVLLSLLAATTAFTAGYLGNEDFWWYLASGDLILERGEIPTQDPFLYTSPERSTWVTTGQEQPTWVTHSWLWTVLLAELDRHFGLDGIAVCSALAVAALTTLVFTRARLDRFGLVPGVVTAFALAAAMHRFTPRTDLASCLLLVSYLVLLDRRTPLRGWTLALLAVLQALWANLHGGYLLGIFAAFAFGIGDAIQGTRSTPGAPRGRLPAVAPLLALGPLLCLASLFPPALGIERLRGALVFVQALGASGTGTAASPISEWQPTYASGLDATAWTHALWCLLGTLSFAAARPPLRLARALAFAGTAVLGASANRFVGVFALTAALVVLANLCELRPEIQARLARLRAPWLRPLHALATALGCALLLATAAALWISRDALDGDPERSGFTSVRPEFSAPGAAAYLREHRLPQPVFNDIALGGYLIDALYPDYRFFIDTRNLSALVLKLYRAAIAAPEAWHALVHQRGIRTVVLSNLSFTPMRLRRVLASDPGWRLVFSDPQAAIFVRADSEPPPLEVSASGHWGEGRVPFLPPSGPGPQRVLRRFGMSFLLEYLHSLAELQQPATIEQLSGEALAVAPGDPDLLGFHAYALLRQNRALEAVDDYARVVASAPQNVAARLNYARALSRSGRRGEARRQVEAAAAIAPDHPGIAKLREQLARPGAAR